MLKLRGFRGDHITRWGKSGRFYEEDLLNNIRKRYGEGGIYLDLGAYIGNHTLFFAIICRADLVIAAEPRWGSYRLLQHNIRVQGCSNVVTHNLAVGEVQGWCRVIDGVSHNLGMSRVMSSDTGDVKVVAADSLAPKGTKMIKIDTEGWALQVLKGCSTTLRRDHPVIVVETQPEPVETIAEYLDSFGYTLFGQFNSTPTYIFE